MMCSELPVNKLFTKDNFSMYYMNKNNTIYYYKKSNSNELYNMKIDMENNELLKLDGGRISYNKNLERNKYLYLKYKYKYVELKKRLEKNNL